MKTACSAVEERGRFITHKYQIPGIPIMKSDSSCASQRQIVSLSPDHLASYAEVLIWAMRTSRAVPFKNGELVLLRYDHDALPLAEAVYATLMDAHLHPLPVALPTSFMQSEHFGNSSFGQLTFSQPGLDELYEATAASSPSWRPTT